MPHIVEEDENDLFVKPSDFGADPEEITREIVQGRVGEENRAVMPAITNIGQVGPEALGLEPLAGSSGIGFRDVSPGSLRNFQIGDPNDPTRQEEFLRSQSGIPIPEGVKRISPGGPFGSGTPADFAAGPTNRLTLRSQPGQGAEPDSPAVEQARFKAAENIARRGEQGSQIQDQLAQVAQEETRLQDEMRALPRGQDLLDLEFFAQKGRAVGSASGPSGRGFQSSKDFPSREAARKARKFGGVLDANAIARKSAAGTQLTNREGQFLKRHAAAQNIIGRVQGAEADLDFLTADRGKLERALKRFQGLPELESPEAAGGRARQSERVKAAQNIAKERQRARGPRITRLKEKERGQTKAFKEFDEPVGDAEISRADEIRERVMEEETAKLPKPSFGRARKLKGDALAIAQNKAELAVQEARAKIEARLGGDVSGKLRGEQAVRDAALFGESQLTESERQEFGNLKVRLPHVSDEDIIAELIQAREGN